MKFHYSTESGWVLFSVLTILSLANLMVLLCLEDGNLLLNQAILSKHKILIEQQLESAVVNLEKKIINGKISELPWKGSNDNLQFSVQLLESRKDNNGKLISKFYKTEVCLTEVSNHLAMQTVVKVDLADHEFYRVAWRPQIY